MIQSVDERGAGLRVAFFKLGDRYAHAIGAVLPGEIVTPLLVSVEGTDQDLWPPSPPLQSLSIEQRPTGAVALLVGMAGRSHWSASVEANKNQGEVRFELACRLGGSGEQLKSTYRRVPGADLKAVRLTPTSGSIVHVFDEEIILEPVAGSGRWSYVVARAEAR